MKKFIPILSLTVSGIFVQNCTERDETGRENLNRSENINDVILSRKDSANSSEVTLVPDPPVRDGDNWRKVQNRK